MRLINARTRTLDEFFESATPPYAILSHTWGDGEICVQDLTVTSIATSWKGSKLRNLPGYSKIAETCSLALKYGLEWAWVDTCCIDKSSSAELTEAINSMFCWYRNAAICFVFLSDLGQLSDLPKCRWFTRGWTLQEMLAPAEIKFYNHTWTCIGTKETLLPQLSTITGIREAVLAGDMPLSNLAVAEKMSWAAHRETTRPEDSAYCLFGLFDVNMPLIYGEGNNAFRRLQEEIIRRDNDLTIFAWEHDTGTPWNHGLFAASPRDFAVYRDELPNLTHMESHDLGLRGVRPEYTLTNSGLRMYAGLKVWMRNKNQTGGEVWMRNQNKTGAEESYLLELGTASTASKPDRSTLCITLVKIGAGLFLRRGPLLENDIRRKHGLFVLHDFTQPDPHDITIALSLDHRTALARIRNLQQSVLIRSKGPKPGVSAIRLAVPNYLWDSVTETFFCPHSNYHASAALVYTLTGTPLLVIIDRRSKIPSANLVDLFDSAATGNDVWIDWLFKETHGRDRPTWNDLYAKVGERAKSLGQSVTLRPPNYDSDKAPIKATAHLMQRIISLEDVPDLPPGIQLPPDLLPRYELVIQLTREVELKRQDALFEELLDDLAKKDHVKGDGENRDGVARKDHVKGDGENRDGVARKDHVKGDGGNRDGPARKDHTKGDGENRDGLARKDHVKGDGENRDGLSRKGHVKGDGGNRNGLARKYHVKGDGRIRGRGK